jgi:dipeptidyl aminopeptidase/acylaminoacyl peptidase
VIFGASFGGYSALWGITEATELYKCAIVICPLTVVGAANEEGNKMFGGSPLIAKYWQQVFGIDVSNTREVAKKASPLYQMNKLASGVSIQLFHGENDPRAPFEHSVRVIDEVNRQIKKGKNISGEFVSFADEGHGICKEENVLYMYKRIEQYLCRQFNIDIVSECNCENNTACVRWSSNEVPINISEKEDSNMYKKQQ